MKNSASLSEVNQTVETKGKKNRWRTLLAFIGPAYLVSVGYMDPGNWATDLAGGSKFGYQLLWVLLMSNLMALVLQNLAARLGIVSGLDLAQASRQQYPKLVNGVLYVLAEIAIAACDLAEVIGMAIGLNLLFKLPLWIGVSITVLDSFLILFLLNKGIRAMEVFILSLISVIGISFVIEMIIVKPILGELATGFVPSIPAGDALYIAIGIIGATVMPHNLYLHSSLVQTRKITRSEEGIRQALKFNLIDSTIALNLAFFVNAAILILAASAFYKFGLNNVTNLFDAHQLLQAVFGSAAPTCFAIALIAAGQSSTITGTLAGQIVMEGYLNLRISPRMRRFLTRAIAIVPALITILLMGDKALSDLLILSQVILSLQLGFAIVPLIHFTSDKSTMKQYAIKPYTRVIAWLIATVILFLNTKLVVEEVMSFFEYLGEGHWLIKCLILLIITICATVLIYIFIKPFVASSNTSAPTSLHGEVETNLQLIAQKSYKHIAITVDFSSRDQKTMQHALSLGGKKATYLLIHVVETAGAFRLGKDILDSETQYDELGLKKYEEQLGALGYIVETRLGYGKSAKAITEIVNATDADLLVMGAHGHKAIKDIVLGSTVDWVRHEVRVPVLIVN